MTDSEFKILHAYLYQERLALLGFYSEPPAWAHNMAVVEADKGVASAKAVERENALARLRECKESL